MNRLLIFCTCVFLFSCRNESIVHDSSDDDLNSSEKESLYQNQNDKKFDLSPPDSKISTDEQYFDTIKYSFIDIVVSAIENNAPTNSAFLSDVANLKIIENKGYVLIIFDEGEKKFIKDKLGEEQLEKWKIAYYNFYQAFIHANGRLYFGRSRLAHLGVV